MDQQREQASQIAHEFIIYQESEQADIDAKDHQFDALWQYMMYVNLLNLE